MNFRELLDAADYNKEEAKYEASFKRYSSDLPPPKKNAKSGVQTSGIQKFLQRRKAEEEAKVLEAKKQKEQLMVMRSLSTKNNKKAKIMASRTKDNDFSRIRLTEDEIESKKKIAAELQLKHLAGKKERMKARIDLEEKEALQPKKRKRKSKAAELEEEQAHFEERARQEEESRNKDKNPIRKAPKPPPAMSFSELLKVAEKKQHEPIIIQKKKQEEEKLLTKKERKLKEEEELRLKRKEERIKKGESSFSKPNPSKHSTVAGTQNGKGNTKSPHVVHVEKQTVASNSSQKFKIPNRDSVSSKNVPNLKLSDKTKVQTEKQSKVSIPKQLTNHDRTKPSATERPLVKNNIKNESRPVVKKSQVEKQAQKKNVNIPPVAAMPVIDTDAIAAAIEKRIREKIEKEIEEKLIAKFQSAAAAKQTSSPSTVNQPAPVSLNGKKVLPNQPMAKKVLASKSGAPLQKRPVQPEKRPFHPNPYLDPPRRRLEPQRPQKPVKRRIESDDEDDDDDMSDFIDDGTSQNDEDYSKYITEIFGYDRRKYADVDDDDIVESSFMEQMKEETRSAKLGYLEDLEEERKLREMEKKRKMKRK